MGKASVVLLSVLVFTFGCSSGEALRQRPDHYYESEYGSVLKSAGLVGGEAGSLFSSDSDVISDDEIGRILAFDFVPQQSNRIAVMPIGQIYWSGWSDDLDRAGSAVQEALVKKLEASEKVYDASYLPTLLVPERKTIGYLREAAARYQADMLLIYKTSFRSYEKYDLFSPDKVKAYCNLEAVLLDTRSGIVPFTTLVSRTFTAEKSRDDLSLYETLRKAELTALESALLEVGSEVTEFLARKD